MVEEKKLIDGQMTELTDEVLEMIEEFKKEEQETIYPLDTLIGVFAHLQPMVCYRWNDDQVHFIFNSYKEKDPLTWLRDNTFRKVLTSLHIAGLCSWVDLRYLMITYKQHELLNSKLGKFNDEQLSLLREVADRLHNELERE